MHTLEQNLEAEFGFRMNPILELDFYVLEAVVRYLQENKSQYEVEDIKKIYDDFVYRHVTNTDRVSDKTPLVQEIDNCFNAWWKNQPAPRSLEEQYEESIRNPYGTGAADSLKRVLDYQDEQEMYRQMAEGSEDIPQGFKANNTPLIAKLLSKPEDMSLTFLSMFKNVTIGQLNSKLEEAGILDKSDRAHVEKYLLTLFKDPNAITALTDNKLPLQMRAAARWIYKRLKDKAVYTQDSGTWYYLQQDNKYTNTPDSTKGNPLEAALNAYYDFLHKWACNYPPFSNIIAQIERELQRQEKTFKTMIGTASTHTESDFNNKVINKGILCTPNGLYDYFTKISDSNGLTKVTTHSSICDNLKTNEDLRNSEGVQLFNQFMNQIQPDPEICDYLVGVIANAITGNREGEYTYILHGPTGANGKSVLMALLQDMLGDYYADYTTECLVRGSKNNKPALSAKNLENRRLVGGREIGDGSTIDGGVFKDYFSNDSYSIELKYKNPYSVMPTHTMFLPVNQMPNFGSDPAVRRRLVVIPFTEHFVNNPDPKNPHEHKLDPNTLKNLIAHEDEIFTYLVHYAKYLQSENKPLEIPQSIQHYGDNMVDETNILADFIACEVEILTEEQIKDTTIPTPMITAIELYDRYKEYVKATPGVYNPYKSLGAFLDALFLKYPQLKPEVDKNGKKKDRSRTIDGHQVRGVIRGLWLDPTTTTAKQLNEKRWDKEKLMSSPYPTFKATEEYEAWRAKQTVNEAEQYANEHIVKPLTQSEPAF